MGHLYSLSVGISLKDNTRGGLSSIERQAANAEKKTVALQKAMAGLDKSVGNYSSRNTAQEKYVQLSRQEIELRKQLAVETDAEVRTRMQAELDVLRLQRQEIQVKKQELQIRDKLLADSFKQQQRYERLIADNEKYNAAQRLKYQRQLQAEEYKAKQEQERRDLRSIKFIAEERQRASERVIREENTSRTVIQGAPGLRSQAGRGGIPAVIGGSGAGSSVGFIGSLVASMVSGSIFQHLFKGYGSAVDMSTVFETIRLAGHATDAQMKGIRLEAYRIAANTAQSVGDVANELAAVSGAGLSDPKQLQAIAPKMIAYADTQFLKNKTPFDESVKTVIKLSHLMNAYSPEKIGPLLDALNAVSYAMPDKMSQLLTQVGYYAPVLRKYGVPDDDMIKVGGLIDILGLGKGKGGTSIADFTYAATRPAGRTQTKQTKALRDLGILNADGTPRFYSWSKKDRRNEFDIFGALEQVERSTKLPHGMHGAAATAWQARRIQEVRDAFGLQGGRAANAVTSEGVHQFGSALGRIHQAGGVSTVQRRYMELPSGQQARIGASTASLFTVIGESVVHPAMRAEKFISDRMDQTTAWFTQHEAAARGAFTGLIAIGAELAAQVTRVPMLGGKALPAFVALASEIAKLKNIGIANVAADMSKISFGLGSVGKGFEKLASVATPGALAAIGELLGVVTGGVALIPSVDAATRKAFPGLDYGTVPMTWANRDKIASDMLDAMHQLTNALLHPGSNGGVTINGGVQVHGTGKPAIHELSHNLESVLRSGGGQPGPTLHRLSLLR